MTTLTPVLDPTLIGQVVPAELSERSGIPLDRITALLENDDVPSVYELGEIAEVLSINPSYLIRPRPSVIARRDSGVDNTEMDALLERFDLHVEAYSVELAQPEVTEAFPAKNSWGARSAGELWVKRQGALWADIESPDPLIDTIETEVRIPVLIWPVPDAPFGATLRLGDVLAIWVNSHGVPGTQQRFTLGHELGHILLRHAEITHVESTTTPEQATSVGSPEQRTREEHANAFAGGALYDYERIHAHWDGDTTPESVAHVAANLGISFEAALVGLKTHLKKDVAGIDRSARTVQPYEAFRSAGYGSFVDWYFSLVNQKRVPENLPHNDLLKQALVGLTIE
jgi:Zn-dependent peptidase ImmA (M78 family)/transcriptional regulator with XRE-family HTH domain